VLVGSVLVGPMLVGRVLVGPMLVGPMLVGRMLVGRVPLIGTTDVGNNPHDKRSTLSVRVAVKTARASSVKGHR
jgi:hypothetical protein